MSFLSRLRTGPKPESLDPSAGSGAGTDAVEGLSAAEVERAQQLRDALDNDPNDAESFGELAEYVRRNAAATAKADPLTAAEAGDGARDARLAVWALAEELAGSPRAWFPLLELARLSLPDDTDGATRRLAAAVERENSGEALTSAIRLLRDAHRTDEAYNFGVAHWRPAEHGAAAGRELVLAALEALRPLDAKRLLADLDESGQTNPEAAAAAEELRTKVSEALNQDH